MQQVITGYNFSLKKKIIKSILQIKSCLCECLHEYVGPKAPPVSCVYNVPSGRKGKDEEY